MRNHSKFLNYCDCYIILNAGIIMLLMKSSPYHSSTYPQPFYHDHISLEPRLFELLAQLGTLDYCIAERDKLQHTTGIELPLEPNSLQSGESITFNVEAS